MFISIIIKITKIWDSSPRPPAWAGASGDRADLRRRLRL